VTAAFLCQVMDSPIRYLTIPLSVRKLPNCALQPLLDRVTDNLPIWKGRLLHRSGQLALINSTMSVVPIYTSISIRVPPWFIRSCHKIMSVFLWIGMDTIQNGKTLVSWSRVQCPLRLGGLGILDMRLLGVALRVCWMWLLKTNLG
jgi:hypothetical protein